ncbi:MAG: hypothetical protein J6Y28_06840 [Acholeplasmatales bacterium]|nr:hypothetical protein [Acholeplasmatales bacterium]
MKELIEQIKSKYTGDREKDTEYLLEEMDKYRDNIPVIKEITKLLYELLPQDLKNNFISQLNQGKFGERLGEIREFLAAKNYKGAMKVIDITMDKIEPVFEDEKHLYMTFHDPFEAYFYAVTRDDKTKFIKNANLDYGTYYKFKGIALLNLKRYDEAIVSFNESLKWNPLDFECIFNYAETLFQMEKYEEYLDLNMKTMKKAYTNYVIAQCYHNVGKYYMTKNTEKDDKFAYMLISYSLSFQETEYAYKNLNTICEKYKWKKEIAKSDDVFEALKKKKFPTAPDEDLIRLLIQIARRFMGVHDEFSLQVFRLIYHLTHDEITYQYIKTGERVIAEKKAKAEENKQ